MRTLVFQWVMVFSILCASLTYAQPGEGPGGGQWDRERVETVIIGKFVNELELTTEQAEKFFPRFRTFRDAVEQEHKDQRVRDERLMELGQAGDGDQAQLNKLLSEQQESMNRIAALKNSFLTDVSSFLSPSQTARCSLLLDEVPRKIKSMLEERRGGGLGGGSDQRRGGHRSRRY